MNKKQLYIGLFSALLVGMYCMVPMTLGVDPDDYFNLNDSPCGWASLADVIEDAEDDVVRYAVSGTPGKGAVGDYVDEIDIVNITLGIGPSVRNGPEDLIIWFAGPLPGYEITNHSLIYIIFIDNNTDGNPEYILFSNVTTEPGVRAEWYQFYLLRIADNKYWCEGFWVDYAPDTIIEHYVQGNLLYLYYIGHPSAIPELSTSRIAMIAAFDAETHIYADFVPLTPSSPIPGFPLGLLLFSLLTLLGLGILLQKNRIRF